MQAYQIEDEGAHLKEFTNDYHYEEIIRLVEDLVSTFFISNIYPQIPLRKQSPKQNFISNIPSSPSRRPKRKRLTSTKAVSSFKKRHLMSGALNLGEELLESEEEDYGTEDLNRRAFSR